MSNLEVVRGLEPSLFWRCFAALSNIPRGSGNEAGVRNFIAGIAGAFSCERTVDEAGNLLVFVPASEGYEQAPSIAFQSHLDMVCEKREGVSHDFLRDPISLVRNGNEMKADGTTAGFDNGVGVAAMMALAMDRILKHGPLELLFTVSEEVGLVGAKAFPSGLLASKCLINLDGEEFGTFWTGSAGSEKLRIVLSTNRTAPDHGSVPYKVRLSGFPGGHSGLDIDKGKGNAIGALAGYLHNISEPVRIISFTGGKSLNAIPNEAEAVLSVSKEALPFFRENTGKKEFFGGSLEIVPFSEFSETLPIGARETERLIGIIKLLPSGPLSWSRLVQTSANVATVSLDEYEATIVVGLRSSDMETDGIEEVKNIRRLAANFSASVFSFAKYPSWTPKENSPLLALSKATHLWMFGELPRAHGIHGGVEPAAIGEKYPDMDMVCIGPTILHPHSPDETLFIDTVPKFWTFLVKLLRNMA